MSSPRGNDDSECSRAPARGASRSVRHGKDGEKDKEEIYARPNGIKEKSTVATGTREKISHKYNVIKRNKIL